MQGKELIRSLVEATGLPKEPIETELMRLTAKNGFRPEDLEMEELRILLADYLQDVLIDLKTHLKTKPYQICN